MPTIITCDGGGGSDVKKSYPDPALELCVHLGDNVFTSKRVDAIQVGDYVCDVPGETGPSLEVTQVEVV